jgi:aminopeptidase N
VNIDYNSEGMENQTLTVICGGCWRQSLIAHEYAHQWFGDMITCGSWADLWINEGFATYCEALYDEHRYGYERYKTDIQEDANGYFTFNPGWPLFNPAWRTKTPNSDSLFDNAITYNKGSCVLHMLRYVLGDSLFFNVLKTYAHDEKYKFGNIFTEDLVESMSRYSGQDLKWFFNEWLLYPNHPVYNNSYKFTKSGTGKWKLIFNIQQDQKNSAFHQMPVVLKINFENNADTNVRVLNNVNNQNFEFTFNKKPKAVLFDPDNDIVLKEAVTKKDN